jgi:hypothetical protein
MGEMGKVMNITDKAKAEAKNLEWRATYTKVAIKAAALAADSSSPLVCRMQCQKNQWHYCDACHVCTIDCDRVDYGSESGGGCPVGRSEPTYTEQCEHEKLSKEVRAAEEKLSDAIKRQFDSLAIVRHLHPLTSVIYLYPRVWVEGISVRGPSEAMGAFALDVWRVKNVRSELKKRKMEYDHWLKNSSDMFKRILEMLEKETVVKKEMPESLDEYDDIRCY